MKKPFLLSKKAGYAFLITCLSFVLILGACSKDDDPIVEGDAYFKIVNSVPASNPQDFYMNDAKITTSGVAFGEDTEYLTVRSGVRTAIFADEGSQTANSATNVNIKLGSSYTVFHDKPEGEDPRLIGVEDDLSAPASGKAKVRFVHLNSSMDGTLVIGLEGADADLVNDIKYPGATQFFNVEPNVNITVASVGSATPLVILGSDIVAGKIYTVWFSGDSTTELSYHIITHN